MSCNRVRRLLRSGWNPRLLVTASHLVLCTAILSPAAAGAADRTASDEASFKAAITAANADVDPTASITLTSNVTIADPATMPALTRAVTINLGGFQLNDGRFNSSGALNLTGGGQALFNGSNALGANLSVTDSTLRLNSGVTLTTPAITQLAGSSTLWVSGPGSTLTTNEFRFGPTAGTVTVNIENGGVFHSTYTGTTVQSVGSAVGAQVNVNIAGAGSLMNVDGQLGITTSSSAAASVTISNGGALTGGGTMRIGSATAVNATPPSLLVTGPGSSLTAPALVFSQGTFDVLDGAGVAVSSFNIGGANGTARLLVSGPGSSVTSTGALTISSAVMGVATLTDGGALNVGGLVTLTSAAGRTGVLDIGGVEGSAAAGAGVLNAATLTFGAGTARLNFNHTGTNYDFDAAIAGAGAINQVAGVTHLTAASTGFTGVTTVSGGELHVDGTLGDATSSVAVNAGGRLGGSGTVGGDVTVNSGGAIAPGNSPGTLTIAGDLTLNAGSTLNMEFGQAGAPGGALNDLIVVNGALTLDGTLNVTHSAGGAFGDGVYRVIDYTGAFIDNTLNVGTLPSGAGVVQTSIANQVNLVVTGAGGGGGPFPTTFNFWDGDAGPKSDGQVNGGSGVWQSNTGADNWTTADGATNSGYADGAFAIFAARGGVVTIDNGLGAVSASGLQFAADGYRLTGAPLTLVGTDATLRVGDATTAGAGFTAIVDAELTGAARLVKTDAGTLVLTAANSYAGGTRIEGGTLVGGASSFGAGAILNNAALVLDQATDATFVNVLDGAGSFTKTGSGRLTYTGTATLTGPTVVAVGDLAVNGSLAGSAVSVRSGASLSGGGAVGAATIESGGVVAPGNGLGTLKVEGDLRQAAGSTYAVDVDPNSNASDLIQAAGSATIEQGAILKVSKTAQASYRPGAVYTVLTAPGGVTGAYTLAGDTDVSAFLGLQSVTNADSLTLVVAQTRTLAQAARTWNQTAAANGVDDLGPDSAVRTAVLNTPDEASAQNALDQLSGEIHASGMGARLSESVLVRDAALARLRCVVRQADHACEDPAGGLNGWAQILGSWGKIDGDGNAAKMDRSIGGVLIGADAEVGGWRMGAFAGYSRSDWDVDARASSGQSDDYHLGAYGGRAFGALNVRFGASYAWHAVKTERSLGFSGFADRLNAAYDANTAQAFAELSYRIDAGGFVLEPLASLAQVRVHADDFTETGGAAALSGDPGSMDSTVATLGVRPSLPLAFGSTEATLKGAVGWRHAFGDVLPTSSNAFAGGSTFSARGTPLARDTAAVELGLDLVFGQGGVASLNYGGEFSGKAVDQRLRLDVRMRF